MPILKANLRSIGLKRFAGPLMLGLKYINLVVISWAQSVEKGSAIYKAITPVAMRAAQAGNWVKEQVPATVKGFKTSLEMAVFVATNDYDALFPPEKFDRKLKFVQQVTVPNAGQRLDICLRMWKLVILYIQKDPDTKVIRFSVAREKVKALEAQIAVQQPPPGSAQKRRSLSPPSPPQDSRPRPDIESALTVSQENRKQYYEPYDPKRNLIPRDGLTQSPVPLFLDSLKTLYGQQWLDDRIVDAYMTLICHEGNNLFGKEGPQKGSPKWHTSSVHWPGADVATEWPPSAYPEAKLEDVEHHFFPRGAESHWTLFHLSKAEGKWSAQFYSSLPGYDKEKEKEWPLILSGLMSLDFVAQELKLDSPGCSPRQNNSNDCGVLMLCTARWIVESWPLTTLKASDCPHLRERMIVELGKWRLHF